MRKAYQKVLINLQVTIVMGKVCCSVERCETLLVTLIYFCPVVEKVVNLRSTRIDMPQASFGKGKGQSVSLSAITHHI